MVLAHVALFWERIFGWILFLLTAELIAAMVLLFNRQWARRGYYLVVLNLLLYAGFLFAEMRAHPDPRTHRTDWLVLGIWGLFFAAAMLAARFMVTGQATSSKSSDTGS
jgi:hypothetical protein